jgi:hypothetical protein
MAPWNHWFQVRHHYLPSPPVTGLMDDDDGFCDATYGGSKTVSAPRPTPTETGWLPVGVRVHLTCAHGLDRALVPPQIHPIPPVATLINGAGADLYRFVQAFTSTHPEDPGCECYGLRLHV